MRQWPNNDLNPRILKVPTIPLSLGARPWQRGGARTVQRAAALAASIAQAARTNSLNQHYRSPWVVAVRPRFIVLDLMYTST